MKIAIMGAGGIGGYLGGRLAQSGEEVTLIARRAASAGAVPGHAAVWAALSPHANGAPDMPDGGN